MLRLQALTMCILTREESYIQQLTYNKRNAKYLTAVIMIRCLRDSASNNLHCIEYYVQWYIIIIIS